MSPWSDPGSPIETARLRLEPLRLAHAEEMATVLDDPKLHEFIGGQPATAPELRARYARITAPARRAGGWLNWVVRQRESGLAIGTTQVTLREHDGRMVGELAWVIAVPSQGLGYATEAVTATMQRLRGEGVALMIAHIHPDHDASIGVAGAVGLKPTDGVHDGEIRWISEL